MEYHLARTQALLRVPYIADSLETKTDKGKAVVAESPLLELFSITSSLVVRNLC